MTKEEVVKNSVIHLTGSMSRLHITSQPIFNTYNGDVYVSFLAYRIRQNGAPFRASGAYLVKLTSMHPAPRKVTRPVPVVRETTGDDLLSDYYRANRRTEAETVAFYRAYPVRVILEAADLCGVDASGLTRGEAIRAIEENF
jgi:hypothetical protein